MYFCSALNAPGSSVSSNGRQSITGTSEGDAASCYHASCTVHMSMQFRDVSGQCGVVALGERAEATPTFQERKPKCLFEVLLAGSIA
jgi:hypothetical protein